MATAVTVILFFLSLNPINDTKIIRKIGTQKRKKEVQIEMKEIFLVFVVKRNVRIIWPLRRNFYLLYIKWFLILLRANIPKGKLSLLNKKKKRYMNTLVLSFFYCYVAKKKNDCTIIYYLLV